MTKKIAGVLAVCTILGAATSTALADPPPPAARQLARFLGDWSGKGKLTVDRQSVDVSFALSCQSGAGGFGIRCAVHMKGIPGIPSYEEMDIMGFDPGDGLVHWYSVTNGGETHDHKGSFDGNSFQATYTGPSGGNLFTECNTFRFEGDRKIHFTSVSFMGQKAGPTLEGTVTR